MPGKNPAVQIHVRGQRIQGVNRQYINQLIAISPPRISGSIDEKLAVLTSLGIPAYGDNDGTEDVAISHATPSRLATAAGFTKLEYQRKYPRWTSTDILA